MSDDKLEFEGVVIETNKGVFKVSANNGSDTPYIITARLAGKVKMNDIRVIVGDKVIVETSVYDLSLGRITKRLK